MMLINIYDAKTNLSKILKQVLQGEEIIIAKGGVPLVRLTPYTEKVQIRKGGQFKGLIEMSEDFDAPLPDEILKKFHGDES